jgi:hypothetical protein
MHTKCTKSVCKQLNVNIVTPTSVDKWNLELKPHGVEICVNDIFTLCFKTTKDSSIQWMQYRLLHRSLPVKYYLKKINILPSDGCTFCDNSTRFYWM